MPGSSEKVNYSLRPAKQVERKMLLQAIRVLSNFESLKAYQYIGFGALYFVDFSLLHKAFGLTKLLSIEGDSKSISRYRFNKPFKCIQIKPGMSTKVLPKLEWKRRSIVWLDYDYGLESDVLTDIGFVVENARSGSMILVTIDANNDDFKEDARKALIGKVGAKNLPRIINYNKDFQGWGTASIYRKIINEKINASIRTRNGRMSEGDSFFYHQLFNFQYSDGTRMLTVGGIIYQESERSHFGGCDFQSFDFCRTGEVANHIEIPKLTNREIKYLDTQLPNTDLKKIIRRGIPEEDVKRYSDIYPYFPTFAETEF